MKNELYRGGFHIFPGDESKDSFDSELTHRAKKIMLDTARGLDKPTIINMAVALGMLRDRVRRLMEQLGIKEEYLAIKESKKDQPE